LADSTEAKDEKKPEQVASTETAEKKLDGVLEPVAAKDSSIKSGLGAQDKTETAVALKAHDAAVLKSTDVSELPKVEIGSGGTSVDTPEVAAPATKLVRVGKDGQATWVEVPIEEPAANARKTDTASTGGSAARTETVVTGRDGVRTTTTVPVEDNKPEVTGTGRDGVRTATTVPVEDNKPEVTVTGRDGVRTTTPLPAEVTPVGTETSEYPSVADRQIAVTLSSGTVVDRTAQTEADRVESTDLDKPPTSYVASKGGYEVPPPPMMGANGDSSYANYAPPYGSSDSDGLVDVGGTKPLVPVEQAGAVKSNDELIRLATEEAVRKATTNSTSNNTYDGSAPLTTGVDGKTIARGPQTLDPGLPPISKELPPISKGDESFAPPSSVPRETYTEASAGRTDDASLVIPTKPTVPVETSKVVVVDIGAPPLTGDKSVGSPLSTEVAVAAPTSEPVAIAKPKPQSDTTLTGSSVTYDAMGNVTGVESTSSPVPVRDAKVEDFSPPVATRDATLISEKVEKTIDAPGEMGPVAVYPLRDDQGRVTATKDGLGQVADFKYGEDGKLAEITSYVRATSSLIRQTNTWEGTDKNGAAISVKELTLDKDGKIRDAIG
jgi:YD repeat-containing protein